MRTGRCHVYVLDQTGSGMNRPPSATGHLVENRSCPTPPPTNALRLFDLGKFAHADWHSICSLGLHRACRPTASAALGSWQLPFPGCVTEARKSRVCPNFSPFSSLSLFPLQFSFHGLFWPANSGRRIWKAVSLEIEWGRLLFEGSRAKGTQPRVPRYPGFGKTYHRGAGVAFVARFGDHHIRALVPQKKGVWHFTVALAQFFLPKP